MRDYQTKQNKGGVPDSINTERFGANEFNSIAVELENAVSSSGQTLATADGTGEVSNQLAISESIYSAGGSFYADSGVADAYVLSPIGSKLAPNVYFEGMEIVFKPGNPNTGASTVNVNSLGVKSITDLAGNPLAAGNISGITEARFNFSADRFEISVPLAITTLQTVVDIGDWNMDANGSVSVTHGVTFSKIRGVHALVRNDTVNSLYPLSFPGTGAPGTIVPQGEIGAISDPTLVLLRLTSGFFDSTNFDSTSFNRGWVVVTHFP